MPHWAVLHKVSVELQCINYKHKEADRDTWFLTEGQTVALWNFLVLKCIHGQIGILAVIS